MLQDNRNIRDVEPYIYIGYSKRDTENVSNDVKWMTSAGYKVKFNNTFENYQTTQQNEEIKRCKQFVAFLSDAFKEDENLKNQIDYALANKICIAIVYIGKVTLNEYYDILFSSINSIEKYDLNYNDYFHRLASLLDEKCKNVIFQNTTQKNKRNFKVNINYDSIDEKLDPIEDIEDTKHFTAQNNFENKPTLINETKNSKINEINQTKKSNIIEIYKLKISKKHTRKIILITTLVVALVVVIFSIFSIRNYTAQKDYTTGLSHYKGEFGQDLTNEAFTYFSKSANNGNADAMLYLGKIYLNGYETTKQDKVKAIDWITKSATQGNAPAEQFLADLYYTGNYIKQDYAQALKWFLKSAENKNANAQEKLGEIYLNGYGTKIDYSEAAKWFELSVKQGNSDAELNLGYLYNNGYGVVQDYNKALSLYLESAAKDNSTANYNIGILYENGFGVAQDYKKALDYYQKAADKSSPDAEYALGNLYYTGHGVAKDNKKAAHLFVAASKGGSTDAPAILKVMYESKISFSYIDLADMYYYGFGVKKNLASAKNYYQRSANSGDEYAKSMIKNGIFS